MALDKKMHRKDELRNVAIGSLYNVINILETDDSWKKVMEHIPKHPQSEQFEPKYNTEHQRLIQDFGKDTNQKCTEILLNEWGTSGKIRPTVETLFNVVKKAQILRAADEIALLLGEPMPSRPLHGPGAEINIDITCFLNDSKQTDQINSCTNQNQTLCDGTTKQMESLSDMIKFSKTAAQVLPSNLIQFSSGLPNSEWSTNEIPAFTQLLQNNEKSNTRDMEPDTESTQLSNTNSQRDQSYHNGVSNVQAKYLPYGEVDIQILEDSNLISFKYGELETATNIFSEDLQETDTGHITGKIGEGSFGEVFIGTHRKYGILAIKKIKCLSQFDYKPDIAIKLFNSEVTSLAQLRHNNIVPILGYSIDGPRPCIVCQYINGGSLEKKIAAKVLNETQRLDIMLGTAEGLKYIHNTVKPAKGDSNTINTYLIHGDVKSANILLTKDYVPKLCDFGLSKQLTKTYITSATMGTSSYMPPEGFSGTITNKTDTYSFGIVLLELLSGLSSIVTQRNGSINIRDLFEEACTAGDFTTLLDPVVERWTKAQEIYEVAKQCLDLDRNKRPSMDEICINMKRIHAKKT